MSEKFMYKRGPTWTLRIVVVGQKFRESLSTSDVKVARERRDKRIAEIIGSRKFGEVRHRWEDAVAEWAKHGIGDLRRTTIRRYVDSLTQCKPFLTGVDLGLIDGNAIQKLIQGRRTAGVTAATIRRDLTAVSQVLEYAEEVGWREGNPTLSKRGQKGLKEKRDPIVLPSVSDMDLIVAQSSPRFGGLIRAALLTGCRQDELCSLTWGQYQAKKGTLEVIGKGNKRRTLQLSEAARTHLEDTPHTLGSDLIFCTPQGTKWASPASYFVKIRDRVTKENPSFKPFRFHDLRHKWAVDALKDGMGLYRLSKHLGHTSVMVTEKFYLEFLTAEEAEAAKAKSA